MVTGCLAANGMWIAQQQDFRTNAYRYLSYENQRVKRYLYPAHHARDGDGKLYFPLPAELVAFHDFLENVYPHDATWGFKTVPELYGFFCHLDPIIVCVRRKFGGALASSIEKASEPEPDKDAITRLINWRMDTMGELVARGGFWVDADRLIKGDLRQIEAACEAGGLAYQRERTLAVIDPSRWHHR